MNCSCADDANAASAQQCGQQDATGDYHGNSPSRNCAASGESRVFEKTFGGRALDQTSLVQEQDLVAEAVRLTEVVRHHHDLGAGGVHARR